MRSARLFFLLLVLSVPGGKGFAQTLVLRPSGSVSDTLLCTGDALTLRLDGFEGSPLWDDGSTEQSRSLSQPGLYWVRGRGSDHKTFSDTIRLHLDSCACTVKAPNAFTPGDDGITIDFSVVPECKTPFEQYRLRIFNRWGILVFSSDKPEKGWDGTGPGGAMVPIDVYVWVLNFDDHIAGQIHPRQLRGQVSVVR